MRSVALVGLVALAGAACGPRGAAPTRPADAEIEEAERRAPWIVARNELVFALARDATHLYWADMRGVHRRRIGGADDGKTERVAPAPVWGNPVAMVIAGDRVVVADGNALLAVPVGGGALAPIVDDLGGPIVALAAHGDEVVAATPTSIVRVARGAPPKPIVKGQTRVVAIAIAGDHVYWSDYGEEPAVPAVPSGYYYPPDGGANATGNGAIRRAPLAGGRVEELAGSLAGPAHLATGAGRVWWVSDRGDGIGSLALGSSGDPEVRRDLAGAYLRVAVDDAGVLVHHAAGYVLERRRDAPPVLRMAPDTQLVATAHDPVLTDDWVYLVATRPVDGTHAVVALPRQPEAVSVVATTRTRATRVRAHDGELVWTEEDRERGGIVVRRADGRTGKARELAHHAGAYVMDLAWNGAEIYFAEDLSIYRVPRGGGEPALFASSDSNYISGLTVHRKHVYWLDGTALVAKRRKGGAQQVVARSPTGYTRGEAGIDLVFDDEYAYLTLFDGTEALFRISERGRVEKLWDGMSRGVYVAQDLVKIGDDLFLYAAQAIYRRLPGEEPAVLWNARAQRYVYEIAGGAGLLYAIVVDDAGMTELVRIDPTSGDGKTVARWTGYGSERGALAVDDVAAYVAIDSLGGVIRVTHDAPAVTAIGSEAEP